MLTRCSPLRRTATSSVRRVASRPRASTRSSSSRSSASAASTSTSRCCSPSRHAHHRGLLLGRLQQAQGGPRQAPDGRRGRLRLRRAAASSTRRSARRRREVRPPRGSLFFFVWVMNLWSVIPLAQFPVTSIFSFPVGLAAAGLHHLGLPDVQEARLRRRRQEPHGLRPSLGAGAAADHGHRVLLEPAGPAVHPRRAALREHVRRPHAARAVHHRQLVPAQRHRPRLRGRLLRDDDRA